MCAIVSWGDMPSAITAYAYHEQEALSYCRSNHTGCGEGTSVYITDGWLAIKSNPYVIELNNEDMYAPGALFSDID